MNSPEHWFTKLCFSYFLMGLSENNVLINGTFEGATKVETEHSSSEKFRVPQLGAIRVLRTIFQGIHNLRDEVARGRPEALQSPTSLRYPVDIG